MALNDTSPDRPRLLITLGDVAGIGPEVLVRAWDSGQLFALCRPVVVGDVAAVEKAVSLLNRLGVISSKPTVTAVATVAEACPCSQRIDCLQATNEDLSHVDSGKVSATAGRAAYDFLTHAIDRTVGGEAEAIVTLPIHKPSWRAAGIEFPGHTEVLARRTRSRHTSMMLFWNGLGVSHVTLHRPLRDIWTHLTVGAIEQTIRITAETLTRLLGRRARIGVCGVNPHASDGGLFGNEESEVIAPAIAAARKAGVDATGPWPADTLFLRARQGRYDGIVAMYHDQGHLAIKLLAGYRAVNVTLGLPIIRTSVAHGTAFDIAGRGVADSGGLIAAAGVAARLVRASARFSAEPSALLPCKG